MSNSMLFLVLSETWQDSVTTNRFNSNYITSSACTVTFAATLHVLLNTSLSTTTDYCKHYYYY